VYILKSMTILHTDKERWRLAQLYASMSEAEVTRLAAEASSLSDAAQWALKLDLARRGLRIPLAEPTPAPAIKERSKVVILRKYMTLPEALLAKSILDSAGIESFLADQNIIRMDWFLSNALGGVKLRVREEDAEEAAALLGQSRIASAR
jgi:Putative prokaryotic signal transducing protein